MKVWVNKQGYGNKPGYVNKPWHGKAGIKSCGNLCRKIGYEKYTEDEKQDNEDQHHTQYIIKISSQ